MIPLLIVVGTIFLIIIWLLVAPISLYVDTSQPSNILRLAIKGIFSYQVYIENNKILIQTTLLFISWKKELFEPKKKPVKRSKKKQKSGYGAKGSRWIRMIWPILKPFKLQRLSLDIDTGDYVLNACLIPLFVWINKGNVRLSINYQGDSRLYLIIHNRLGSILPVIIKYALVK